MKKQMDKFREVEAAKVVENNTENGETKEAELLNCSEGSHWVSLALNQSGYMQQKIPQDQDRNNDSWYPKKAGNTSSDLQAKW